MNMKQVLLSLLFALLMLSCGGDEATSAQGVAPGGGTPLAEAPKILSTSPANGADGLPIGDIDISLVFNQEVRPAASGVSLIQVTGGTAKSIKRASATTILVTVNCTQFDTTVSIAFAQGLVTGLSGRQSEAYTLTFTTQKKPEIAPGIPETPQTASTESAKQLYSYLLQQYGKKTISSVMADVNWNHSCADKVYQLTGKYPAMNCYDFIHICFSGPGSWIDYSNLQPVKEWADAGGLVQLMWHFNVPKSEGATDYNFYSADAPFRPTRALTAGTWEHQWFYDQMDRVADILLQLQQAGIAATWRPFHEAAGNATARQQADWTRAWFWWGIEGAAAYKRLWVAMFDYFQQKGIHNLIWVWTTQNYNGNSSQYRQDTEWYPGDAYVDIVARDLYGYNAAQNLQEFSEIQARYPHKMVALGECGQGDGNDPSTPTDFWKAGALWSHFMVWYQQRTDHTDTMCSDDWWRAAMSSPYVITRDQLP